MVEAMEQDWELRSRNELRRLAHKQRDRQYRDWLLGLTLVAFAISGIGYLILRNPEPLHLTRQEVDFLQIVACLPKATVIMEWLRLALTGKLR